MTAILYIFFVINLFSWPQTSTLYESKEVFLLMDEDTPVPFQIENESGCEFKSDQNGKIVVTCQMRMKYGKEKFFLKFQSSDHDELLESALVSKLEYNCPRQNCCALKGKRNIGFTLDELVSRDTFYVWIQKYGFAPRILDLKKCNGSNCN